MNRARKFIKFVEAGYADVVGYTYDADMHCLDCTEKQFGPNYDDDENPPIDSEGNEIHPMFSGELEGGEVCGDCFQPIGDELPDDDLLDDDKYEIVQTVDDKWMILVNGVQWGEHRDRSGAGDYEAATREEAEEQLRQIKAEDEREWKKLYGK